MLFVFIIIIIVLLIGDLTLIGSTSNRAKKCTGCGNILHEKYIQVNEKKLIQPLYYCSEQCKIDHIDRDRKKFTEIELYSPREVKLRNSLAEQNT